MPKKYLTISTPTESVRFVPDKIVYILADGNYSEFYQVDKNKNVLVLQLGKVEEEIDTQLGDEARIFIRIGKSYIINRHYIYHIKVQKKELVLSDMATFKYTLNPSKEALKSLKERIDGIFKGEAYE
jgi:DNA-binding LytR/AlgR family response regulator